MSVPQMTTAAALRSALASTIACSAQELQEAVGQVVVTTAAELPASSAVGPADRSLFDAPTSTLVLLADRIPAGQEAQVLAAEIARHHGRQAAQAVFGERANELLGGDGGVSNYIGKSNKLDGGVNAEVPRGYSLVTVGADWLPSDMKVPAYSNDRRWNGWVMPAFTIEAARSLLEFMPDLRYDSARDSFISAPDDQDEEEIYGAESLVVDGRPITTYAIGAGSWCWSLAEQPEQENSQDQHVVSFRAECDHDVDLLLAELQATFTGAYTVRDRAVISIPDVKVELGLKSPLTLEVLQRTMRTIPDSHVMLRTLRATPLAENSLEQFVHVPLYVKAEVARDRYESPSPGM